MLKKNALYPKRVKAVNSNYSAVLHAHVNRLSEVSILLAYALKFADGFSPSERTPSKPSPGIIHAQGDVGLNKKLIFGEH